MQPNKQKEPLLCDDNPSRFFESITAYFFTIAGKSFLVITDQLLGWPAVVPCGATIIASCTVCMFCRYFQEVGVPLCLWTDGGIQFTSTNIRNFTQRWGVHHVVSSSHYPQSNGHAEAAIKSVKHLILKTVPSGNINTSEFNRGLLELHNTPNYTGRSPAQVTATHYALVSLPTPTSSSKEWQDHTDDCDHRAATCDDQVMGQYKHVRPLPRLSIRQP